MNRIIARIATISSLAWVLSGCSIVIKNTVNRFDSPEANGRPARGHLGAAIGGSNDVVLTDDFTYIQPNTVSPAYSTGTVGYLNGGIGVAKNIDLELRTNGMLQVKYQFLGSPRVTAEEGNTSLAVTAALGYSKKSENSSNATCPGSATCFGNYNMSGLTLDSAFIFGYRAANWVMIYGGPYMTIRTFKGEWNQTAPSVRTANFSGRTSTYGMNVGVELGTKVFQGRVEGGCALTRSGRLDQGGCFGGASITFQFGGNKDDEAAPSSNKAPAKTSQKWSEKYRAQS